MDKDRIVDLRTREQKIGDSPRYGVPVTAKAAKTKVANAAQKAKRKAAEDLALDYTEMAILGLAAMATDPETGDQARVNAFKTLIEYGIGKPKQSRTDVDGAPLLPNLIILSGDGLSQVQTITADYTVSDDNNNEEEE